MMCSSITRTLVGFSPLFVLGLWLLNGFGLFVLFLVEALAVKNVAGHTAVYLYQLLALFVPLVVSGLGFRYLEKDSQEWSRLAHALIITGVFGVSLLVILDQANLLVYYETWLKRGQPNPPEWRRLFHVGFLGFFLLIQGASAFRFTSASRTLPVLPLK